MAFSSQRTKKDKTDCTKRGIKAFSGKCSLSYFRALNYDSLNLKVDFFFVWETSDLTKKGFFFATTGRAP